MVTKPKDKLNMQMLIAYVLKNNLSVINQRVIDILRDDKSIIEKFSMNGREFIKNKLIEGVETEDIDGFIAKLIGTEEFKQAIIACASEVVEKEVVPNNAIVLKNLQYNRLNNLMSVKKLTADEAIDMLIDSFNELADLKKQAKMFSTKPVVVPMPAKVSVSNTTIDVAKQAIKSFFSVPFNRGKVLTKSELSMMIPDSSGDKSEVINHLIATDVLVAKDGGYSYCGQK